MLFKRLPAGFQMKDVYRYRKQRLFHYARRKLSFLIASLSLFTFLVGNMVGQHGWYAFWKSVMGKEDDALIVFNGTVAPVQFVPDYRNWAMYGGNPEEHTYRMVPAKDLIPLPSYNSAELRQTPSSPTQQTMAQLVYSIAYLGDYETGTEFSGSHVGIDIRVPIGTPVMAIANGIVEKATNDASNYGHYVVIRHPNVPDPAKPGAKTTVWSIYAHLDSIMVTEGTVVGKGQQIATSGQTGFATGPHLHFQLDNADAPFHPYWPFTGQEARDAHLDFTSAIDAGLHQERGIQYTLNPMPFVQKYETYSAPTATVAVSSLHSADVVASSTPSRLTGSERIAQQRSARLQARLAKVRSTTQVALAVQSSSVASTPMPPPPPPPVAVDTVVTKVTALPDTGGPLVVSGSNTDVDHLEFQTPPYMDRSWQKIRIYALDSGSNIVRNPSFGGRVYLVTAFGDAEFKQKELSSLDFVNGIAVVDVLTRGQKTVILQTKGAFEATSRPMVFER